MPIKGIHGKTQGDDKSFGVDQIDFTVPYRPASSLGSDEDLYPQGVYTFDVVNASGYPILSGGGTSNGVVLNVKQSNASFFQLFRHQGHNGLFMRVWNQGSSSWQSWMRIDNEDGSDVLKKAFSGTVTGIWNFLNTDPITIGGSSVERAVIKWIKSGVGNSAIIGYNNPSTNKEFTIKNNAASGNVAISAGSDGKVMVTTSNATGEVYHTGNLNPNNYSVPVGGIIMWSGTTAQLPGNWKPCDGTTYNGITTPDLRNRFVVGAGDKYAKGVVAGEEKVTLTTEAMPVHTHPIGSVGVKASAGGFGTGRGVDRANNVTLTNDTNLLIGDTGPAGGLLPRNAPAAVTQAHNNMPPYHALFYIMRIS